MNAIGKLHGLCKIIANGCGFSSHDKQGSTLQIACLINQAFVFSSDKYTAPQTEPLYGSLCSRALVIEPEPSLQLIYRKLLRQQGCYSVVVNTIAEALAMIDQDFDLVYVDCKRITVQDFLKKAQDFPTGK